MSIQNHVFISHAIRIYITVSLRINAVGVYLIFNIFFFFFFFLGGGGGGVYSREAFTRGRRLLQNTKKLQFYISTSMISSFSSIRKMALSASSTSESVISSNGLGRSGSSKTLSCDINCSLPF